MNHAWSMTQSGGRGSKFFESKFDPICWEMTYDLWPDLVGDDLGSVSRSGGKLPITYMTISGGEMNHNLWPNQVWDDLWSMTRSGGRLPTIFVWPNLVEDHLQSMIYHPRGRWPKIFDPIWWDMTYDQWPNQVGDDLWSLTWSGGRWTTIYDSIWLEMTYNLWPDLVGYDLRCMIRSGGR